MENFILEIIVAIALVVEVCYIIESVKSEYKWSQFGIPYNFALRKWTPVFLSLIFLFLAGYALSKGIEKDAPIIFSISALAMVLIAFIESKRTERRQRGKKQERCRVVEHRRTKN